MIEFVPIASSSAGCAYLIEGRGLAPLLLDAGLPFRQLQKLIGFGVSDLAGVLITHAHGDHSVAVRDLLSAGVDVYASVETFSELGVSGHRAKALEPRQETTIGGWSVLPFDVVHDSPGSLGFVVGHPDGQKLLYLTDSAYSKFRFEGLSMIAVECNFALDIIRSHTADGSICPARYSRTVSNHMSLDRLIDMLRANDLTKVEEIWLLHLSDANSDEERFADEVRRATGKPTFVAAAREAVS